MGSTPPPGRPVAETSSRHAVSRGAFPLPQFHLRFTAPPIWRRRLPMSRTIPYARNLPYGGHCICRWPPSGSSRASKRIGHALFPARQAIPVTPGSSQASKSRSPGPSQASNRIADAGSAIRLAGIRRSQRHMLTRPTSPWRASNRPSRRWRRARPVPSPTHRPKLMGSSRSRRPAPTVHARYGCLTLSPSRARPRRSVASSHQPARTEVTRASITRVV